jgi:hypothetical protein
MNDLNSNSESVIGDSGETHHDSRLEARQIPK